MSGNDNKGNAGNTGNDDLMGLFGDSLEDTMQPFDEDNMVNEADMEMVRLDEMLTAKHDERIENMKIERTLQVDSRDAAVLHGSKGGTIRTKLVGVTVETIKGDDLTDIAYTHSNATSQAMIVAKRAVAKKKANYKYKQKIKMLIVNKNDMDNGSDNDNKGDS